MRTANHIIRLSLTSLLIVILGGYVLTAQAEGSERKNISRVNSSIEIESGQQVGNVNSVNGSIRIGRQAIAADVETVNGRIDLESASQVDHASTVNGRITAADNVAVEGSLETVNGAIRVREGGRVKGRVRTVNGDISLRSAVVTADLQTSNGDIDLRASEVKGDIVVKGRRSFLGRMFSFGNNSRPDVTIDSESIIHGSIILEQEVDLRIDASAQVGEIIHDY